MQYRRQFYFYFCVLLALLTISVSAFRVSAEPIIKRAIAVTEENINNSTCVVFGVSNGDSLNVRSSPSASSIVLFTLTNDQEVLVTGNSVFNGETKWMPVDFGSRQGWVNGEYLQAKVINQNQPTSPQITQVPSLPNRSQHETMIDQSKITGTTPQNQDTGAIFIIIIVILAGIVTLLWFLFFGHNSNSHPALENVLSIEKIELTPPEVSISDSAANDCVSSTSAKANTWAVLLPILLFGIFVIFVVWKALTPVSDMTQTPESTLASVGSKIFSLGGANEEKPPADEINSAIEHHLKQKRVGMFTGSEYVQVQNKVCNSEIINYYTRKIEGETWHVYDVQAVVSNFDGKHSLRLTIAFVKRGSVWYSRETDE